MNFFDKIEEIQKLSTEEKFSKIVNPLTPIFICDHYLGNDELIFMSNAKKLNFSKLKIGNNLLDCKKKIKKGDLIAVQIKYLPIFLEKILPQLKKPIKLMTYQWNLPQIHKNNISEFILNHPMIQEWYCQNPIYPLSTKYKPFPYGIMKGSDLVTIVDEILLNRQSKKDEVLGNLWVNKKTNKSRQILPDGNKTIRSEYYSEISKYKFVLSPAGDRDDTYRHYESIALGTIPIANVGENYKYIFEDNMYYVNSTKEMVELLENNKPLENKFKEPNRNIILTDYWVEKYNLK